MTGHDPDQMRLVSARIRCRQHVAALQEAQDDLANSPLGGLLSRLSREKIECLNRMERRLLDQFAYRYTRLQDDMGARLLPAILQLLGEDVASMSVIDRLNRLEQINWLPSAQEWQQLRYTRNAFTHDYPETAEERWQSLQQALSASQRLVQIFTALEQKIDQRWGVS
ncbi:MAG: hypothetical protein HQL58_09125 [Magnetococcales bacterium]|nr:hypothetical protein [Magnetococcales bacterium]